MQSRSITIDLLKGIAIIAIVLFHAGILRYGYLGVEVFFVIGGFLITKSIIYKYENDTFKINDIKKDNELESKIWGGRYINMMLYLKNKEGRYKVFTSEKKIISYEGLHLTRYGAIYYAQHINFNLLFKD